jgi:hypothetical protein
MAIAAGKGHRIATIADFGQVLGVDVGKHPDHDARGLFGGALIRHEVDPL